MDAAVTTSVVSSLSSSLRRLHANNLQVVPQIGRTKTPFPMREACPDCPDWRDTGDWNAAKGCWRRIPPQRAHAQDVATAARDAAIAAGADAAEVRRAYAETEERVLREHDAPDRPELWDWHVRGNSPDGRWYHRGVYSHRERDSGIDVCWDIDKGQDPLLKARVIRDKLRELGLGASTYENTSFSGNGAHVRLCHDLAPSWLRYAFGRRLLEVCGYTPGNDPAKGQTESFPKQEDADYVGNMIGLPCSLPRMAEGATCVLDENLVPMRDAAWAADRLGAVRLASLPELFAAARSIGLDPTSKPVAPEPVARPAPGAEVVVPIAGGGSVTYRKGSDRLGVEVRSRISMTGMLQQLGATHKGGDKYCCVVHHEPADGNPSFHVYVATRLGESHDRYQCFGDCKGTHAENGDVIALYGHARGLDRRTATLELARQLGLDPSDYQDTVKASQPVSVRAFDGLADWCSRAFDAAASRAVSPLHTAKAIARVMFQAGISYDRAGATIWKGLGKGRGWSRAECYANVAETLDALQNAQARAGTSWLQRKLGMAKIREFGWHLSRATQKPVSVLYKLVIGFPRLWNGSPQRNWMRETYLGIPEPPRKSKRRWQPTGTPQEPTAESKVRSMIRRPTVCRHFAHVARDSMDGHRVAEMPLACGVDTVCMGCAQVKALGANSIVTGEVKPVGPDGVASNKYNWESRGPFFAVTVAFPVGCEDYVDGCKKAVNRGGEPKLCATSCDPLTGARRLIYLADDRLVAGMIRSAVHLYACGAQIDMRLKVTETYSHLRAAAWILDAQLAVTIHSHELINREDRAGLLAWCDWWKGRHKVVSRSARSLPWPPREVVRKATQLECAEIAEYPGQIMRYDLVHRETGYVLARDLDNPVSIDEAANIAGRNDEFGTFQAAHSEERRRPAVPA